MRFRLLLPFFYSITFFVNQAFAQKAKDVKVIQFDYCNDIKGIDFDTLSKNSRAIGKENTITIILLRAESTHADGGTTINPLDQYIIDYDTSLIHLYSFELKYTKGSNSCEWNYIVNGSVDQSTKGNPPFMCLASDNPALLDYMVKTLNLSYFSKSNRYLVLSERYSNDKGFYKQLNRLLHTYDQTFVNSFDIHVLKQKDWSLPYHKKNYLSLTYSNPIANQVLESGIKSGNIFMTDIRFNSVNLNYQRFKTNETGLGLQLGLSHHSLEATLGINGSNLITDTVDRKAQDKDGDTYTRIASAKGLEEKIAFSYLGLMVGAVYKIAYQAGDNTMKFSFGCGLKASNFLKGSYYATTGQVSWGGYYPQYDSTNTLYGDSYGFYKNEEVYKGHKHLEINPTFVSTLFNIDWEMAMGKSGLYFKAGLFGEFGNNVLNANQPDRSLSYSKNDYNSLLYRNNVFKINAWGLNFGLSYLF